MPLKDLWEEAVTHALNFTVPEPARRLGATSPDAFLPELLGPTGNPMRIGLCDPDRYPEWACTHLPAIFSLILMVIFLEVGLLEGAHSNRRLRIKIINTALTNGGGSRPSRVEVGPTLAEQNPNSILEDWRLVFRNKVAPLQILLGIGVCLLFSQATLWYHIVMFIAFLPALCLHETLVEHKFVQPLLMGAFLGFQCAWVHPRVMFVANVLAFVHTPYCPVFKEDDAFASRVRLASVGLMNLALPEMYFLGFALSMGLFFAVRLALSTLRKRLQNSVNQGTPDPVCHAVLLLGGAGNAMLVWKAILVAIERSVVTA